MKKSILIKIILILLFLVIIFAGNVNAMYQSTPYTHQNPTEQTWDTWLTNIRKMETDNQVMGLTETLDGTNATSDSNNIDVHMMKGTEYYAISILSASVYGNPNNSQRPTTSNADSDSTNKSGVYYNYGNWEYLASLSEAEAGEGFNKYFDKYNTLNLKGLSPSSTYHSNTAGGSVNNNNLYWYGYEQDYNLRSVGSYRCKEAGVLSSGYNGIFSYNWKNRIKGYRSYSYQNRNVVGVEWGNITQWTPASNVEVSSYYARAAIVNSAGI